MFDKLYQISVDCDPLDVFASFSLYSIDFSREPSVQADWKPESPERFAEIVDLIKSIDSLKVEEKKSQGSVSCLVL